MAMSTENKLIASNPNADVSMADEVVTAIGAADVSTTTTATTEVNVAENLGSAVEILGQGMASIFVVLGLIAVVVAVLKKLDNKKK